VQPCFASGKRLAAHLTPGSGHASAGCYRGPLGPLAQLVAHLHDAQGVRGSSPLRPTTSPYWNFGEQKSSSKGSLYVLVRGFDGVAVADVDLVEHGGVEQPPGPVAGPAVGGGTTRREPHGEVHDFLPVVEARVEGALADSMARSLVPK
jgi:hypothetical protein